MSRLGGDFCFLKEENSPSLRGKMAGAWGLCYGKVNNILAFTSTSQNILFYWCLFREKFNSYHRCRHIVIRNLFTS